MKKFIKQIQNKKPIIAMLHLTGKTSEEVVSNFKHEIEIFYKNGVDAILVENYWIYNDPNKSLEHMKLALKYLQENHPDKCYGVNFLYQFENNAVEAGRRSGSVDAETQSFKLADEYGACFVQAESVAGHVKPAHDKKFGRDLNKLRETYPHISLVGGVRFKYQPELSERLLEEDLAFGVRRCDAVVVSGAGTGMETNTDKLKKFKQLQPAVPMIIGSGLDYGNAAEQFKIADGGIVGTYLKWCGKTENIVSENRVQAFVHAVELGRNNYKDGNLEQ